MKEVCSTCEGPVKQEPLCPGWIQCGKWYQCYPACGNACLWECANVYCGWWFIDGMNPNNTLYHSNEERRPMWLKREEQGYGEAVARR